MPIEGSSRARKFVTIALCNQGAGSQESSRRASAALKAAEALLRPSRLRKQQCVKRSLEMSDRHIAPTADKYWDCSHGEHVLGLQGMVPARKNKGLSVSWYDDAGEISTWLPLRGVKARKHLAGGSKVKQAGGKFTVNEEGGGPHKDVLLSRVGGTVNEEGGGSECLTRKEGVC
jgi:hypothetical protein